MKRKLTDRVLKLIEVRVGEISHNLAKSGFFDCESFRGALGLGLGIGIEAGVWVRVVSMAKEEEQVKFEV